MASQKRNLLVLSHLFWMVFLVLSLFEYHTHLHSPHNSSIHLMTTKVWCSVWVKSVVFPNWMRSGWTTLEGSVLSTLTSAPTLSEWPCQEQHESDLTAFTQVLHVYTPVYSNGLCTLLQFKKKRLPALLSVIAQSIDLLVECMVWQFWMLRQSHGCPMLSPRSCVAKQWLNQGFSNFFVLRPRFRNRFFNATPLIENLDVNDTCEHPITNLQRHYCLNHENSHDPQK